ncbi:MAG TPA: 23S rRNA (uracil(1939)-C(5))-methyltransferase RlmD [Candidatus Eisenbacteria bacterium]
MNVNELLTIEVERLVLGGKALARHEGRVVFVDGGLPGDRVGARITRLKRGWAEARLESVESPSPYRVEPACPHFGRCGGCRFQDLRYDEQCRAKQYQVEETLARLGGVSAPNVRAIVPAPEIFHYRNKMEFSFHPEEEAGAPAAPRLGLHERGGYDRVFAVETCLLPSALTLDLVRWTQDFARRHAWRAYHPVRHAGVVRFLTVRHLPATGECAVQLVAASDEVPALDDWARGIAALSPEVRSVSLGLNRSRANVALAEEERLLGGRPAIVERLLGLEFEATAGAFLQTNSRQAEALYREAIAAAGLARDETVLDLYCGTGTLTLALARVAHEAVGVETVGAAVGAARRNAGRNRIENARFVEGEARRVLREWARGERPGRPRPAVVVVDPPRAGLHPRVVARIAELEPRRVVYVSCHPGTLARDVKDFAARGYTLAEAAPFDLFPHTPHIECVARLERRVPFAGP